MQTSEECLLMYRRRLRQLLHQEGIPSNPGVTDDWILERIEELVGKSKPQQSSKPETSDQVLARLTLENQGKRGLAIGKITFFAEQD